MTNDSVKFQSSARPHTRAENIAHLFRAGEAAIDGDMARDCLIITLKPVDVKDIDDTDAALKAEMLESIANVGGNALRNTRPEVKFYVPSREGGHKKIYCNLHQSFFQVVSYDVAHTGQSLPPVPKGVVHMVLWLNLFMRGASVAPASNDQLAEIISAFPEGFRIPVTTRADNKHGLLGLMLLGKIEDMLSEDGMVAIYAEIQLRKFKEYLRSFYGHDADDPLGGNHKDAIAAYIENGGGNRAIADSVGCQAVFMIFFSAAAAAYVLGSTTRSVNDYLRLMDKLFAVSAERDIPDEILEKNCTELSVMAALHMLAYSQTKFTKDLTDLSLQKEIVTMLLHDTNLRTAVVFGAVREAFDVLERSPDEPVDHATFTQRFPQLALGTAGLPESIRAICQVLYSSSGLQDASKNVMTQLCAVTEFHDAVMPSIGRSSIDKRSILLNDAVKGVIASDPDVGLAIMAMAMAQSRRSGNSDIEGLCEDLVENRVEELRSMSADERLALIRDSVEHLSRPDLETLVAATVAYISSMFIAARQCSYGASDGEGIIDVLKMRNDAIIDICITRDSNLDAFFLSLVPETLCHSAGGVVVNSRRSMLRFPDTLPTYVSDITSVESQPGPSIER
ncbi:hypothetical protein [Anaplasma capra]|uniref:hypothetical protein n=1 Tax=Anaplasma capra TaxID=1562740 RepID=UPI0021D5D32F|nr:hypothetical protein [Anaplasma capra]MCU7611685.1 hypothetical protein [Anaplasma capra]MCU7612165.1 hypothetical protein [Anaplasma capra]